MGFLIKTRICGRAGGERVLSVISGMIGVTTLYGKLSMYLTGAGDACPEGLAAAPGAAHG